MVFGFFGVIGLCQCLLLGYLLASKVDLATIVMEIYGWLFLIVWCGVFGKREIVGVLKTMSVPCLTSSFYFLELYWTGSLCGETILFRLSLDLLDFCNVRFWYVHPCILPVYLGVSLFLISINLYYLSKKKFSVIKNITCLNAAPWIFPSTAIAIL